MRGARARRFPSVRVRTEVRTVRTPVQFTLFTPTRHGIVRRRVSFSGTRNLKSLERRVHVLQTRWSAWVVYARGLTQKMLHGAMAELHAAEPGSREQTTHAIERLFLRGARPNTDAF